MKVLLLLFSFASSSSGALFIFIAESGPDVTVVQDGSLDISHFTGLQSGTGDGNSLEVWPAIGFLNTLGDADNDYYFGDEDTFDNTSTIILSRPSNFGLGGFTEIFGGLGEVSGSGITLDEDFIGVPAGYLSGTPLPVSGRFFNRNFDLMGLEEGVYVWDLLGGDSITLTVGNIPEPSTVLLSAIGLLALFRRNLALRT